MQANIPVQPLLVQRQELIRSLQEKIQSLVANNKSLLAAQDKDTQETAELTKDIKELKTVYSLENQKNSALLNQLKALQKGWLPVASLQLKRSSSQKQMATLNAPWDSGQETNRSTSGSRVRWSISHELPPVLQGYSRSTYSLYFEGEFARTQQTFWDKDIIATIDNTTTQAQVLEKTKHAIIQQKKWIPEKYRHIFWPVLLGNSLHITEKLFYCYQRQPNAKLAQRINEDIDNLITHPHPEVASLVKKDILDCLITFCSMRPDFEYSGGLVTVMWMFIIRMEKALAFRCFCNLILNDPMLSSVFSFQKGAVNNCTTYVVNLIKERRPKAYDLLMGAFEGEWEGTVLIQWLFSMFGQCMTLGCSSKVWDLWLAEGYSVFFKTCLAVIQLIETKLESGAITNMHSFRTQVFAIEQLKLERHIRKQKLNPATLPFKL